MYRLCLPFFLFLTSLTHAKLHARPHAKRWDSDGPSITETFITENPAATGGNKVISSTESSSFPSVGTTSQETTNGGAGGTVSLPDNCFKPNGIGLGWLPDGTDISTIQSQVSTSPPCTYGAFAQITSPNEMPDSQIASGAASASKAGAIYQIALQPWIPFSQVSASAVAASMTKLSSQVSGEIWLRLAHEMNWYIDTNAENKEPQNKYHGTHAEFKTMWTNIANAVDRSKVKMFWTPVPPFGGDTVESLNEKWYPGDASVDVVGVDAYGQPSGEARSNPTFDQVVGPFCRFYARKPMHLGETGWLFGGTPQQKEWWLRQVSGPQAKSVCPNYLGFSWFEHDKPTEGDFRLVNGNAGNLAKSVLG
ncbi:MAG: hypothetical protein Q9217_003535 [Psora testacea]